MTRNDNQVFVPTPADVGEFIASVQPPARQVEANTLLALMFAATGQPPVMWGPSIIGFGSYHYRYDSGREGDAAAAGFSPRKAQSTIYLADGFDSHKDLLARLGPHTLGKSCLYLKKLDQVDLKVLQELVSRSYRTVTAW